MKVVLFCGGYGMRMKNSAEDPVPKPMQMIGNRPLLWHVMRYYAHFGHKDFILCLGYGAEQIKHYFLEYAETESNDFVMHDGRVELISSDIGDWKITFADTGLESPIGERLRRVRHYLGDDTMFLANYADVLTDASLDDALGSFVESGAAASMMLVPSPSSFHFAETTESGQIQGIHPARHLNLLVNGGYFVLTPEVIDLIPEGGDLVGDACVTLAAQGRLFGHKYDGFWMPADTFKERAELDAAYQRGDHPWKLWDRREGAVKVP